MNLSRYLTEDLVKLEMTSMVEPLIEGASREKWMHRSKEIVLEELVGMESSIHSALEVVGQNAPEFRQFSELTKKIRKSGDILIGTLQKRKEVLAKNIQSAQNQVKLQSYSR